MKMLVPVDNYPDKYWLSYDHEKNLDALEFRQCREVVPSNHELVLRLKAKVSVSAFLKYDYFLSDGPSLASRRFAEIIKKSVFRDCIQFVPATVIIDGQIYAEFFLINYLRSEKAFDMEKCVYAPLLKSMPDGPKKFDKIVLLDKTPVNPIFRAEESKGHIVLSNEAATFLATNKVIGLGFVDSKSGL